MKKLITGVRDHFNFGKFINHCFVLAMSCFLTTAAYGQINVGLGGVSPITFDATPAITPDQWATLSIGTAAGTLSDGASVRARVQAVAPGSVTTALTTTTTDGTAYTRAAQYCRRLPCNGSDRQRCHSTNGNIAKHVRRHNQLDYRRAMILAYESRPPRKLRQAMKLVQPGSHIQHMDGHPRILGSKRCSPVTATLNTAGWAPNTDIYILWADDNGATNPDGAYSIDNFTITAVVPGTISAITITNQPQNLTVTVPQSATFSVGASGAPQSYFWRKNGAFITERRRALTRFRLRPPRILEHIRYRQQLRGRSHERERDIDRARRYERTCVGLRNR
jgi:hypothetical protein